MPVGRRWKALLNREAPAAWLLAAPALLGLTLFVAVPFALALGMSFTDLRMGSPLPTEWQGLAQYRRILTDPSFLHALRNNAVFAAVVVPLQTALALGLALLLDRPLRGMVVFRTLFFLPVVFPMALVAVVWILIYAPGPDGLMNAALDALTLGYWEPVDFLHNPYWALPAIMLLSIWQGVGFQMVILLAALQGVPRELHEAARMDGAGPVRRFWHVTLPQLRNPLIFVGLVTAILSFRLFDQVQIMTQGGPLDATTTVMYEAVTAVFERQRAALGAAMTVVFFLLVLGVTVVQRLLVREEREIE
ncbi:carbohydrate ABC transporter permease [Thiohalorhabdus methylotrophus]|uniref:Carbohydrate ABC transporter permease n=1 Tax=Thiohalorhabdus methylotrophus TaxID=3242694 RepID=A0ABV4TS63_9GAMM